MSPLNYLGSSFNLSGTELSSATELSSSENAGALRSLVVRGDFEKLT